VGRHNTPIHLLERFREEQRASRAARRAGQQRVEPSEPFQSPAKQPEPVQHTATPPLSAVGPSTRLAGLALDGDRRHPRAASDAGPARLVTAATVNGTAKATLNGTGYAATGGDAGPAEDGERVDAPALAGGLTQREVIIERVRTGIRGVGQALITFGVVILLFVAYELWITDLFNSHTQGQLATQLSDTWGRGEDPLSPTVGEPGAKVRNLPIGQGIALIRIPALGLDYVRVVVEGTAEASLAEGPGHYVNTALPGQIGNFSIAGHRVGKGSPFLDLDRLRTGDPIVIETKTTYYIYRVLGDRRTANPAIPDGRGIPGREIVAPTDTDVIGPVPDHPGLAPFGRFLTLTTCHPRFSARQRLVIHAELAGRPWPKSNGLPPVLRS
jgi:sortase A